MKQLTNQEISSFCEQMEWLVHSGVGVGEAFHLTAEDEADKTLQAMLLQVAERVDGGASVADALKEVGCFPGHVCGSLATGEKTGRLEEAFRALKLYYQEKEQAGRRIKSALLQPTFLLLLLMVVLGVLLAYVIPTFESVYASLGGRMTGMAGVLLRIGLWLREWIWIVYIPVGAVLLLTLLFSVCTPVRETTVRFFKKIGGDRGVMRMENDAAIAQVLAMGLGSGLPLEDTMELAAEVMEDVPKAKRRCLQCKEALVGGIPLLDALKESEILPQSACRLLSVGMQGGNGDAVMREIADKLSGEAEEALANKVDKIEPALVLTVSVLVGMILLLVMLPLMNIMETIG